MQIERSVGSREAGADNRNADVADLGRSLARPGQGTRPDRSDPDYAQWKRAVPQLRADAVLLGTEAGVDPILYWDAGAYRVRLAKEAP
jgi:hypothetical protein